MTKTGGLKVEDEGCNVRQHWSMDKNQKGVVVAFDPPFDDIPSVHVTPCSIQRENKYRVYDGEQIPRCIVESISIRKTRVKCGRVKKVGKDWQYQPIPFTIAAFGGGGKV